MSDIVTKILGRIVEVEDVAEQATSEGIANWTPEDPSFWFDDKHPMARHERLLIAMHDPASVLRRCAADREIVELCQALDKEDLYAAPALGVLLRLARGYGLEVEQ